MSLTLTIVEENGLTVTDDRVVITVGASGPQGATGAAGVGVPAGGTTGQVLAKVSATNYDTQWVAASSGSGDVVGPASSVDGRAVLFDGTTGKLIKQATAAPVLEGDARLTDARTPTAHAASHQDGGTDELALDASQTTSGQFNVARLGTGTPSAYTFLDGTGAWTDNVPVYVPVKNTSGSQIAKGAPIYATGTVGATYVIEIAPADADVAAAMPALGLLESTLAVNATGYAVITGTLRGVDTNAYTVGQELYVSTTAGQLTGTRPTGSTAQVQSIGVVTRVNSSNGEILVGIGHVAEAPNSGIDGGAITTGTVGFARLPTGTTSSTVAAGNDSRFTDARTPTAHKSTHSTGGTDALAPSDIGAAAAVHVHSGADITSGTVGVARLGTGTPSASTFLRGDGSWQTPPNGTVDVVSNVASGRILGRTSSGSGDSEELTAAQTRSVLQIDSPSLPVGEAATGEWIPLHFLTSAGTGSTLASTTANANNRILYFPVFVGRRIGVSGVGVEVTTGNAGGSAVLRMGLHTMTSGRPGTVVAQGTSSATAGAKEITWTEVFLDAGWYWCAFGFQSLDTAGTNPAVRATNTTLGASRASLVTGAAQTSNLSATESGAFTNSPTVTAANGVTLTPFVFLKVSTPA